MTEVTSRKHIRAAAAAAVFVLTMVSAMGALASPTRVPSASTQKNQKTEKTANPLPTLSVTDVKSSKPFALASTFDGKKALLVWFWAPH